MNKNLVILILVFLISLMSVSAVEVVSPLELTYEDIGEFRYVGQDTKFHGETVPRHYIDYQDTQNRSYTVIIHEYKTTNMDSMNHLVGVWVKSSGGPLTYGNHIVYRGFGTNDVFWTHSNLVIRVGTRERELPEEIINAYLDIYPSMCNATSCIVPIPLTEDQKYTFDDPPDFYWLVAQHTGTIYLCPEENTIDAIKNTIKNKYLLEKISEIEFQEMKELCKNRNRFVTRGIKLEGDIKDCFDYLSALIEENVISDHNLHIGHDSRWIYRLGYDRWIYRECYIRAYFNERFNPETVEDYNASYFNNRLNERNNEFIDFIQYKTDFPSGVFEYEAVAEGEEPVIQHESDEIVDQDVKVDGKNNSGFVVKNEVINYPSKSLIQTIKEKIKGFFKWFK